MSFLTKHKGTILKVSSPFVVIAPAGYWAYNKRKNALRHPVMARAYAHLLKDQRIIDFCGENIKPGYWITINEDPVDNYIKFGFTIRGQSGSLGTSVIGDFLTHRELSILEDERQYYTNQN